MSTKKDAPRSVLILAPPGRLRDSLGALLNSVTQIQQVNSADDGDEALVLFNGFSPNLVIIDANLTPDRLPDTLAYIKTCWPRARYVILADDVRQQQTAMAAGADSVLLKGYSTIQLFAAIERLLRSANSTCGVCQQDVGSLSCSPTSRNDDSTRGTLKCPAPSDMKNGEGNL